MSAAALLPGYVGYVRPAPGAQAVPGNFDAVLVYAVVEHRDERRLRMEFQEPLGGLRRELVRLHRRDGVIAYPHLAGAFQKLFDPPVVPVDHKLALRPEFLDLELGPYFEVHGAASMAAFTARESGSSQRHRSRSWT